MVSSLLGYTAGNNNNNNNNEHVGFSSNLLKYIHASRSQLDHWVDEENARVDRAWENHRQRVEKQQAEIDAQITNLLALQLERGCSIQENYDHQVRNDDDHDNKFQKKLQEFHDKVQHLQSENAKLQQKQEQCIQQVKDVTKDMDQHRAKTNAILAELDEKTAAKNARMKIFTKRILQYQQHLGFSYETTENLSLRLWFTLLDANEPNRQFSLRLYVNDQDMFVIEDCRPALHQDTVTQILRQVNDKERADEDFSQLILYMRNAFAATL